MPTDAHKANAENPPAQGSEGACVERDAGSDVPKSCFFAFLDILGFKSKVKQKTFEQLRKIVNDFTVGSKQAVDLSRTIVTNKGTVVCKIELSHIHVRIVSDSIYVWTEDDECLKEFDNVLHIVNAMLASGIENGLPLRGVVTYGEVFIGRDTGSDDSTDFTFDNGSVYGKALVEAYEMESQMDWSGAILTPKAWAKVEGEFGKGFGTSIKCPEELFNHFPYLLWYGVPFKDGRKEAIAFNWNYKPSIDLSVEKINKAFTEGISIVNDTVQLKLRETVRFYEYTQRVAELYDFGSVKMLPVPDRSYVLSDLDNRQV